MNINGIIENNPYVTRPVSIYNADTNEKIQSFKSIKDCSNHLGINSRSIGGYIINNCKFGSRRKKVENINMISLS